MVSIKDEERFYMRMLLLHVPGATHFDDLKTVNNHKYDTFKEAAFHRHLLSSDEEWDHCLKEAATFQMAKELRQTFAFIIAYCSPANVCELWLKYACDMSVDYLRNNTHDSSLNMALHDINHVLKQHGLSCVTVGLPTPTGSPIKDTMFNQEEEQREGDTRMSTLNKEQREAFSKIIEAVENPHQQIRYFFLDGPGGSGKTYLYATLLSFVRGKGQIALPFATTGIATTMLKGGRTVHSGFQLPVPLLETSVSSMRTASPAAEELRQAVLIIVDEITMLPKYGLNCIDLLLREVMLMDKPFGGKVIVVGGDFRQTLPVVPGGNKVAILESCLKSSPIWPIFLQLPLTANMRSEGQNIHNKWLLDIGSGITSQLPGLPQESVEIPDHMVVNENLIDCIFPDAGIFTNIQEIAKHVILAPTNKKTLEINAKVILKIPGKCQQYDSSDSVISEDPNDSLNYSPEFLHELTPSGMPPHTLMLKKGVVIMLLRNLNPQQGLCNGTRLIITHLHTNAIRAIILSNCNHGSVVLIPRIDLAPSDSNLPFTLKRRQFPVIPAFAMTINKSQGQTFERVGIHLDEPVFSHGQLYVALSRCKNQNQVKVYVKNTACQGKKENITYTQNVVYREVL